MSLFALSDEEAAAIAARSGTPCFAYRLDIALDSFRALRAALPDRADIAYAVKANPGAPLIAAFASEGSFFDCASSGELERVAAARVSGSRVLFAGPGKTQAELEMAFSMGARIQANGKTGDRVLFTLTGPLCTALDRLGDVSIPEPRPGDLVMLGQAGAYGFTEAMSAFLSHPKPAEVWLEGPAS